MSAFDRSRRGPPRWGLRWNTRRPWCLVALALLLGCEELPPSRFPHRAHLTATACGGPGEPACANCSSCHRGVRTEGARATEPPSDCVRCHSPASTAVRAEQRRLAQLVAARPAIRFDHATHLPLAEVRGQCVSCHAGISRDGLAGATQPPMSQCLSCHDDLFHEAACTSCHQGTEWRHRAPASFARHDLGFVGDHRLAAQGQTKLCRACHQQSECVDCHDSSQTLPVAVRHADAIKRELPHRADYVSRHAIDARADPASCLRCHEISTCDSCHVDRGISANRVDSTNPHPVGWLGSPTGATFHGRRARRDIISCASCHDQGPATNCIRCHRVGGYGGNPHPDGWTSSQSETEAMCAYCHVQ